MKTIFIALVMVAAASVQAAELTAEEQKCFDAINAFRAEHKLPPLILDGELTEGSRKWSMQMRTTRSFQHAGVGGENIAMGYGDGMTTFRQWERSSGHRAFLLSKTTTHAGIGNDGHYWTFRAVDRRERPASQEVQQTVTEPKTVKTAVVSKKRKYVPLQPARNVLRVLFW